jgi:hypothetical protein
MHAPMHHPRVRRAVPAIAFRDSEVDERRTVPALQGPDVRRVFFVSAGAH